MVKRLIRYNRHDDYGEQVPLRYRWTFMIINEPREIDGIRKKLFQQLAPVSDLTTNYESLIPNSNGLHCEIFSFSSDTAKIRDQRKVYDSRDFRQDRDLSDRPEQNLENYVQRFIK